MCQSFSAGKCVCRVVRKRWIYCETSFYDILSKLSTMCSQEFNIRFFYQILLFMWVHHPQFLQCELFHLLGHSSFLLGNPACCMFIRERNCPYIHFFRLPQKCCLWFSRYLSSSWSCWWLPWWFPLPWSSLCSWWLCSFLSWSSGLSCVCWSPWW